MKTHDVLPAPSRGRGWAPMTWLALMLALVAGVMGGEWLRGRGSQGSSGLAATGSMVSSGAASTSTGNSSSVNAAPYSGRTAPIRAVSASATCTAPSGVDVEGNRVAYDASEAIDGSSATAWRCQGSAVGQSLTFRLPAGVTLVGVGLVNGYAKPVSSRSSVLYYPQYRRITAVKWTLPDGTWFNQTLLDNHPAVQDVLIPPTVVSGPITLTIVSSTTPGKAGINRDAVLISSVAFLTKA